MVRERPPARRRPPDRDTARQAGDGDSSRETAGLGHRIVARYGRSPGLIPMEATLQHFRRTGLFGHDRLPLLTRLSRRWGGMGLPYPGSGGPLTYLQASPFASAPAAGAERIGRPTGSATTGTIDPGAPLSVSVSPRRPLPTAGEIRKRMNAEGAITPSIPVRPGTIPVTSATVNPQSAPAATEPGSAIVRRRRSRPEDPSPDPGKEPPAARHPEATGAATVAPAVQVTRPANSSPLGSLRLSPTDGGLGRPIIRRRKHPSPETSSPTPASVTTETTPPLRPGPKSGKQESAIRRAALPLPLPLPLPVAGERLPSTRGSAPASPTPVPRSASADHPFGAMDVPPPGAARQDEPSMIATPDAAASRGDLGNTIRSRYASTTIAASAQPLPVSTALPRQSGPSPAGRSGENAPALAGNPSGTSTTTTAPETITVPSPTMAYPMPGPYAATVRSRGEQPIRERSQDRRSRPAGRLPTAAPPPHPTIVRTLADTARPHPHPATPLAHSMVHSTVFRAPMDTAPPRPAAPSAGIGSTDALSLAGSPMPLAVQRQAQRFSAEPTPRERFPTTAWRTGESGRAPTGQASGSATAVPLENSGVGTEVEPNPSPAGDGERPNVDDLVDKVLRKLMRLLAIEQERRGRQRWF